MIKIYLRTVAAILAVLFFVGGTWKIYAVGKQTGMDEVKMQWDQQVQQMKKQAEEQAAAEQEVIIKTVTKFVEKAAQERIVYRDIIREVENYVPNTLPMLPVDFRVLHDAAVAGVAPPEAGDPARVAASPVAPATVAAAVADNYAACRYDQGRLVALQAIMKALSLN